MSGALVRHERVTWASVLEPGTEFATETEALAHHRRVLLDRSIERTLETPELQSLAARLASEPLEVRDAVMATAAIEHMASAGLITLPDTARYVAAYGPIVTEEVVDSTADTGGVIEPEAVAQGRPYGAAFDVGPGHA